MRIPPPSAVAAAGWYRGGAGVLAHGHPAIEILRIVSGACRVEVPRCAFSRVCAAGDVLVLPARADHWHSGSGRVETAWVLFDDRGRGFDDAARYIPLVADDPAHRWITDLIDLHGAGQAGQALHLLAAILDRLSGAERSAAAGALHPAVARAKRWIADHRDEAIPLTRLARAAGVSAPHLCDLFRDQLGTTPLRWQTGLRLAAAERLLADPHRTVREAATAMGFADANYFGRVFRRHHGVSPDAWRRRLAGRTVPHGP